MFITDLLRGPKNDVPSRVRPRRRLGRRHRLRANASHGYARGLAVEPLENRMLLTGFLVNTVADDPAADPGSTDDLVSLREALTAANTNAEFGDAEAGQGGDIVDTITFDESLSGQAIVLGGVELTVSDDLSLTGLGAADLTISGNHASGVFSIDAGVTVDISEVAIADGKASDGGGIYNEGALTVANSTLTNNSASGDGGAIDNLDTLAVVDSVLSNNSSRYGGAIVNYSYLVAAPSVTITGSLLTNNSARYGGGVWNDGLLNITDSNFSENSSTNFGGGIVNRSDGTVTIESSTFSGNLGGYNGGAIDSDNYGGLGSLDISNSIFEDNRTESVGGAILNYGPANITDTRFEGNSTRRFGGAIVHGDDTMTVSNCTFLENSSGWYGGAIDNTSYGHAIMKIDNSTLSGNSTGERGGAIENYYGTLEITNSTISGNSSRQVGGGIWNHGAINITNSTIFGNRADGDGNGSGDGGGLYSFTSDSYPKPALNNTILAGNVRGAAESDNPDDIYGPVDPASSHNLIGDPATAGGLIDAVNGNIVGDPGGGTIDMTTVLDLNLADNGGPTLTHALVPRSLAFNAGDNSKAVDADGNPLVYDQRGEGFARFSAGTVDIGALEIQVQTLSVEIDVKPGSDHNPINLASNGVIAVALFTTDDFDASQVDASTVVFAGAGAVHSALEDVDGDGDLDMVLHFQVADTNLADIYDQLVAGDLNGDGILDSNHQSAAVSLTGLTATDEYFEGLDDLDLFLSGRNLRDFLEELVEAGDLGKEALGKKKQTPHGESKPEEAGR